MKKLLFSAALLLSAISFAGGQAPRAENKGFEKSELKVTKAERREFAGFLSQNGTGIVKLWNSPCPAALVIDVTDEKCGARSDVSFGSHYSFSARVYFERFQHINYATLSFIEDEFVVKHNARLVQLLVDLGERDLGAIDAQTAEAIDLRRFPVFDQSEREKFSRAGKGYEFRGLKITDRQKTGLRRTYLLRSLFDTGFRSLRNARRETLFAFQIVGRKDEIVTILWKEIF